MTTAVQARTAAVTIPRADLIKAIRWAKDLPGTPAHGAVRVTVSGGQLVIVAWDFETIRLASLDLTAAGEPGEASVLVAAAGLEETARSLPKGTRQVEVLVHDTAQIDLTADPGTTTAHRATLARLDCDYPALPAHPAPAGLVAGPDLAAATVRVAAAAATRTELPWLATVRMQAEPDGLWLSATDRYKITAEPVPWTVAASAGSWLFPAREAAAFAKTFTGPQACLLAGAGDLVGLSDGTWTVITRRVNADPVDARTFVATRLPAYGCQVTADAQTLAGLLGMAAKIKGVTRDGKQLPETPYVEMTTTAGQDGLTLRLHRGVEEWSATVDAAVDGGTLAAAWNPASLGSLLEVLDGPAVIHLAPGKDGRVLKPAKVTCDTCPEWTGVQAMVDPSR